MRKIVVAAALVGLAGCATPEMQARQPQNFVTPVQAARCDLDGLRASAAQPNSFIAGAERQRVTQACLGVAMLENAEEARRAARAPAGDPGAAQKIVGLAEACGNVPSDELAAARARLVATDIGAREWAAGAQGGAGASPEACAFARGMARAQAARPPGRP